MCEEPLSPGVGGAPASPPCKWASPLEILSLWPGGQGSNEKSKEIREGDLARAIELEVRGLPGRHHRVIPPHDHHEKPDPGYPLPD